MADIESGPSGSPAPFVKFEDLQSSTLISRLNRFVALIRLDGSRNAEAKAHLADSGRLLLDGKLFPRVEPRLGRGEVGRFVQGGGGSFP